MDIKILQKKNNKYVRKLRKKPTKAEEIVGRFLTEKEYYFIFQKGFLKPFHRIVDFYFPGRFLILEVDGKYHEQIKSKDNHKDYTIAKSSGISTIRITNEEVYSSAFKEKLLERLGEHIAKDYKTPRCPKEWRTTYCLMEKVINNRELNKLKQ